MSASVALRAGSRTSMQRSSFSMPGRCATAAILSAGMMSYAKAGNHYHQEALPRKRAAGQPQAIEVSAGTLLMLRSLLTKIYPACWVREITLPVCLLREGPEKMNKKDKERQGCAVPLWTG